MQTNNLAQPGIRELLFGDLPFSIWANTGSETEPWLSFKKADQAVNSGNDEEALQILDRIIKTKELESRQYLQAYHAMSELGVGSSVKELFGVVIEVSLDSGLDIVAAYRDQSARYYNHSGASIICEHPVDSISNETKDLLNEGESLMFKIGPWDGERPGIPAQGNVRINLLTSQGLHFGEGPMNVLAGDPMGGPIIKAAFNLMQTLIGITEKRTA
jgi:hypothetical protein